VLVPLLNEMKQFGDFKIMLLPDHATPLALKTHTRDPVPFAIYDSRNANKAESITGYDEEQAAATGLFVENGFELMGMFLSTN